MERVYRILLLALFILGFVGILASQGKTEMGSALRAISSDDATLSLIHDVRLAQEVNSINQDGRTSEDNDSLTKIEAFLAQLSEQDKITHK